MLLRELSLCLLQMTQQEKEKGQKAEGKRNVSTSFSKYHDLKKICVI